MFSTITQPTFLGEKKNTYMHVRYGSIWLSLVLFRLQKEVILYFLEEGLGQKRKALERTLRLNDLTLNHKWAGGRLEASPADNQVFAPYIVSFKRNLLRLSGSCDSRSHSSVCIILEFLDPFTWQSHLFQMATFVSQKLLFRRWGRSTRRIFPLFKGDIWAEIEEEQGMFRRW